MEYTPRVWQGKIQHIDIDSFHIAVEELYDPWLKKVLAATYRPHGPITSANALAKKLGIDSAMRIEVAKEIAKKKGKELILVREHYKRYAQFSDLFYSFVKTRNDKVEGYSPDELFVDWSEFSPSEALRRAKETLEDAREKLHLRISSCLAPNPFLAKMGTDLTKPNGFLYIPVNRPVEESVKIFYHLPVEKFHGIGERNGQKLRKAGFEIIGDLGKSPLANLTGPFGLSAGTKLYYLSKGIDIIPFPWSLQGPQKSISRSLGAYELDPEGKRNYFLDFEEIKVGFRFLAFKVATIMEEEKYDGKTVGAGVRSKESQQWIGKQKSVSPHFHDKEVIAGVVERELLPQLFTQEIIDRIGLRVTNLQKDRSQLRLF